MGIRRDEGLVKIETMYCTFKTDKYVTLQYSKMQSRRLDCVQGQSEGRTRLVPETFRIGSLQCNIRSVQTSVLGICPTAQETCIITISPKLIITWAGRAGGRGHHVGTRKSTLAQAHRAVRTLPVNCKQ
jgi:hypothetical protein